MLTDLQEEAPAARRLIAFGATFLGLLTLSNANFAGDAPLLAPPLVAIIVIFAAIGGLLIWVNTAYSRAMLWAGIGFSLIAAAGSALVAQPPAWLAYALILLGLVGFGAAGLVAAALVRPRLAPWAKHGRNAVIISGLLIALATAPIGPGPVLALVTAGALMAIIMLLRPVTPDQQG